MFTALFLQFNIYSNPSQSVNIKYKNMGKRAWSFARFTYQMIHHYSLRFSANFLLKLNLKQTYDPTFIQANKIGEWTLPFLWGVFIQVIKRCTYSTCTSTFVCTLQRIEIYEENLRIDTLYIEIFLFTFSQFLAYFACKLPRNLHPFDPICGPAWA